MAVAMHLFLSRVRTVRWEGSNNTSGRVFVEGPGHTRIVVGSLLQDLSIHTVYLDDAAGQCLLAIRD